MATYREFIENVFPNLDPALSSYVNGVLADSEEFETEEDIYDAVGDILLEADNKHSHEDILNICAHLHQLLVRSCDSTLEQSKILSSPVYMGQLDQRIDEDPGSIWLVKDRASQQAVDMRKLQRAELQIQKKLERREEGMASQKSNGCFVPDEATASQQISRRDAKFDESGNNKSYDIKIENFDVAFGEKSLVTAADLHLVAGRRYGFIGRNGLGKTTVLRMLSKGNLRIASHLSVLHVEQEVIGDDTLALQSVLEVDERREYLLKRERELNSGTGAHSSELSEIYQELELMEADKAPARAAIVLTGLGFTRQMQTKTTKEFSGGWRMRLALARALFSVPDLLLLDEPTNMLDMKAIMWLEKYLSGWSKTLIVVSHDREFLNSVTTDILHLHSKRIDSYRGNYEDFNKTRLERLKNQQREYEAQKQYREHAQEFIDKFRFNAKRASLVQSKLKLLEKLPELKPIEKETEVILKFCECAKLSPPILELDEVCFYYEKDRPIFSSICINANMQSRICIVGDNGAGKTTLLKLLLGHLDPISGIRHYHRNLRLGYFSQHHVDQLEMNVSSVELMASRFPGQSSEAYRGKLGSFGISGELAVRPVVTLSGGQKSRVAFGLLNMAAPNFLVLDEPTNHLDMETIEALGAALNKFQGGVILVSHDERLITNICNELWVVADGTVTSLEGGFDQYRKIVETQLDAQL